jgi:hypothetical protein
MPRKGQKIRNRAGFRSSKVRDKHGHKVSRWTRDTPRVDPLAGPRLTPLPARPQTSRPAHPTDRELAQANATANLTADLVLARTAETDPRFAGRSHRDVVASELIRLAAESLASKRRADLLLEAAGIDIDDAPRSDRFNADVSAHGVNFALSRVGDPRAWVFVSNPVVRQALIDSDRAWSPIEPHIDPETGETRLYPEDVAAPSPEMREIEIRLEVANTPRYDHFTAVKREELIRAILDEEGIEHE